MKNITVAEYAELHNISVQAVYKKIDRLETVEEVRNGRKVRLIVVDEEGESRPPQDTKPYSTTNSTDTTEDKPQINQDTTSFNLPNQPFQPENNQDFQPPKPADTTSYYISVLEKQLEEKDRQIERLQEEGKEKDRQIQEQFDRLTNLLLRSQQLEALTHKLLGQGEDTEEPITADTDTEAQTQTETDTEAGEGKAETAEQTVEEPREAPPKKKNWFMRLFGL